MVRAGGRSGRVRGYATAAERHAKAVRLKSLRARLARVRAMQTAEVVLGVLRERGEGKLPCAQLYRQMFNKDLYLTAYGNIYSNQGAMTPGAGKETADGMSEAKIEQIIGLMRQERYRFSPARRTYIPKKNGKLRPLGMPSWSDKLVGEVVRMLLEAFYDPQFSDNSHGFRGGRGCHNALRDINTAWTGTAWFIEGDVTDCFGSLDHEILLGILADKIHDNRFLRLIRNMLRAGYLEEWEYRETLSGCPQGGVASPVLSNIYLHKLDEFIEQELIPQYTRGASRKYNPEYDRTWKRLSSARKNGDRAAARDLEKKTRALSSKDPADPGYRRLRYIRYADDHLLGFNGPKAEAEEIKARIAGFLRETLRLELNDSKTLITHARTQRNTTDFRCFGLWVIESCVLRVLESVSGWCGGHGWGPRVAAGLARGSTVRGPAGGAVPPS